MEVDIEIAPSLTPQQESYLEGESQCCLCGTPLEFQHKHDDEAIMIKEQASCPRCKIVLKEKEFIVH